MNIKTLRKEIAAYIEKWIKQGHRVGSYVCGHCTNSVLIPLPDKKMVSKGKRYWDSATTCLHCSELNFVAVWPDGRTEAKPIK